MAKAIYFDKVYGHLLDPYNYNYSLEKIVPRDTTEWICVSDLTNFFIELLALKEAPVAIVLGRNLVGLLSIAIDFLIVTGRIPIDPKHIISNQYWRNKAKLRKKFELLQSGVVRSIWSAGQS